MSDTPTQPISGLAYYDKNADVYMQTHAEYHAQRFKTFNLLLPPPPGELFDFGCGSADNLLLLAQAGFSVRGVDPAPNLISLGQSALRSAGLDPASIRVGDVSALEQAEPRSIDVVTSLNVLAYLSQEEEDRFFRAARRAITRTGCIVFSVGNALSDIVTFNRYTIAFYERHVLPEFAETAEEARECVGRLKALLVNSAVPPKTTDASYAGRRSSERDVVRTRRVILTELIARLGREFDLHVEAYNFYHFWPLPPQLLQETERLTALQRRFDALAHNNPLGIVFASQINIRAGVVQPRRARDDG